ncbi:MAG: hypothetical protein A3F31_00940 [Candidatus Levybacteria bacterium RIFCSPHIGHO2_12_FULL_38_12]|nr:MAG: hypothetical protein A2770_01570 [Candidatus Levybacteria bacterium RIFCSPHIGHO2_01_FULL_38_12]OGH21986.1 MAG: hypothetical protein A3D75_03100 [Candidatus Levybacteria bacterium RIFCSPHIGHO2_02_FULL_37_18]OGH23057.1 MAG: hypothetical protein A3F31_00940 [Candidatus Levybacteria bacterium RIFCSPHIGHO2_12_FULL_38_12]OGH33679.1 MAG: hypothetical protein A3A47_02535 [Candidatus Levybacteria bacterium RIFCSPLOWO2_01_FULL_37_20]OGH44585.1 MAG: hypothetical protein A3J14_00620 [Candidatus Lev
MRKLVILLFIFGTFVLGGIAWWNNALSAVDKNNTSKKIFVIYKGQGVKTIANNLKRESFIKDPIVFFILVKKLGIEGKIQAGDFRLSPSQSATDIAQTLTHGTLDVWITIPEGQRAGEIADILKDNISTFEPSWKIELSQHEGYLFPDTYLIPKDASISFIISHLKNNFNNQYAKVQTSENQKKIVTIASLIEREAKFKEDRPLVSSVIHNRQNLSMPLQIDATIQYMLGYQYNEHRWWKKNLTKEDLQIDSPYNTYIHPGLPPTPIANPGLSALQAAAQPINTDYLYYISDKQEHNHYAKTLEDHNANIKKYGL